MRNYLIASMVMGLAVLAQYISLAWFNSLALSFLLYTLVAGLMLPLAWQFMVRRTSLRELPRVLSLVPISRGQLALSTGMGLGMMLIMYAAFALFGDYFLKDGAALPVVAQWGIRADAMAFFYLGGLLVNGATEELFWRGMVYDLLRNQPKRWLAVVYPALVFGLQHIFVISRLVPNGLTTALFMVGIIASGLMWGYIREKTGNLLFCVICHVLVAFGYLSILAWYLFS